jgi:hypothetical protein
MSENKIGRYLKYAFGEIILVVIGILIAIQINNWNVSRIEQSKIEVYAQQLIHDLEEDISMSKYSMYQATEVLNRIDSLTQYVQNKNIEDISNLDFLCLSSNLSYRPFSWNRATLEELKNSGSLQAINNDSLKMKIAQYDAFTHHLDQDNINDLEQGKNCAQLINQVIDKNYDNFKELHKVTRLYWDRPTGGTESFLYFENLKGFDFFSTPEYEMAKSQGLRLITNDINKFHTAINSLISLQLTLELRTGIELPKSIRDAEELITLLKEIYLD